MTGLQLSTTSWKKLSRGRNKGQVIRNVLEKWEVNFFGEDNLVMSENELWQLANDIQKALGYFETDRMNNQLSLTSLYPPDKDYVT